MTLQAVQLHPQLYQCFSHLQEFKHRDGLYADVWITWFVMQRSNPITSYASAISGYRKLQGQDRQIAENVIDEFFNLEEAQAFQAYLRTNGEDEGFEIKETEIPIEGKRSYPLIGTPCGGGVEILDLLAVEQLAGSSVRVGGYFDIRHSKLLSQAEISLDELFQTEPANGR